MGNIAGLSEADYASLYDRIAQNPQGLAFLREHARRAADVGQGQLDGTLRDLRALFEQQASLHQTAGRADALRSELLEMAASIEQARREIAALRPKDTSNNRLDIATNELDAIVSTTERASIEILQSAERLMEVAGRLKRLGVDGDLVSDIENEVTNIFTACSFQDLTGQRTSKVVNALRYVEQRINAMISIWSVEGVKPPLDGEPADARPDAHLLTGPRSDGVDQSEVDALMAGAAPRPSPPASKPAPARPPAKVAADADDVPDPLDQSEIDNLFD
ncbi:protein phosphatase CheZ [Niveispirillum fermenti]|uniref:protein phosphatase CheZ n=1 Tax=Niveispirillum fermenti TaxID=1233113 RepID=UPI003A88FFB8